MKYETVIGLEVHVELSTKSKAFCGCPTQFGGEPNTQCCPVCMALPGTLPVLNKSVVDYTIAVGLATNCTIVKTNKFDRKNYFYPDLPKAYQDSQLYFPICKDGYIEIEVHGVKKNIRIAEIHMEEDTGKLIHDAHDNYSLVDFNRCGIPLIEIVSQPDMRSAQEAIAYLENLKLILQYLGVSDCKMQEGSLRADVNVSVRPLGSKEFGVRTEMKNLNSFKAIASAIESESKRHIEVLKAGGEIVQETRRWDEAAGQSYSMRTKEDAQDYRYFPEPDLVPIEISDQWIESIRQKQPELPAQKKKRYINELRLPEHDTNVITSSLHLVKLYEDVAQLCGDYKEASKWIVGDLMALLNQSGMQPEQLSISAKGIAKLIELVLKGIVNRNTAKEVFERIFYDNVDPQEYIEKHGLKMVSDETAIREVVKQVLAENDKSVQDYKNGKDRAFGFLVGQCMKQLKGKANPAVVNKILKELI